MFSQQGSALVVTSVLQVGSTGCSFLQYSVSARGSAGKESACNAGDAGSIPRLGRSPEGGNGNPLQYSCLEIPWTEEPGGVHGVAKNWT